MGLHACVDIPISSRCWPVSNPRLLLRDRVALVLLCFCIHGEGYVRMFNRLMVSTPLNKNKSNNQPSQLLGLRLRRNAVRLQKMPRHCRPYLYTYNMRHPDGLNKSQLLGNKLIYIYIIIYVCSLTIN